MMRMKKIHAALLTGAVLGSTQVQAQAVDSLPDVTLTGKAAVGIFAPASAVCENAVAADPLAAQQVIAILNAGGMPPSFYQPTRLPRNPDYNAPPSVRPGSPLPDISFKWVSRHRDRTTVVGDASMDPTLPQRYQPPSVFNQNGPVLRDSRGSAFLELDGMSVPTGANTDIDYLAQATALCRSTYSGIFAGAAPEARDERTPFYGVTNPNFIAGRSHIAFRDQTLPMGFALFDQGRYAEALPWFEKAYAKLVSQDGGDEAALMMGKIYLQGLGDKSDVQKALYWLDRAANARFDPMTEMPVFDPLQPDKNTAVGEAAIILAKIYLTGFGGVPKDTVEARKWLARAEYVGHIPAGKALGDLYLNAKDAPRDPMKALDAYKKAARYNYPPAQVALGDMYYRGTDGVKQNLNLAIAWYGMAAKYQHPEALQALAVAYSTGEGVPADPAKARLFYKAAAVAGNADAQMVMGSYFYEGNGEIARDPVAARKWFEQAAINAQTDAMYNLGVMMMKGEGGERDRVKAWVWLRLAQRGGDQKAPATLAILERNMTPAERQNASALYTPNRNS